MIVIMPADGRLTATGNDFSRYYLKKVFLEWIFRGGHDIIIIKIKLQGGKHNGNMG